MVLLAPQDAMAGITVRSLREESMILAVGGGDVAGDVTSDIDAAEGEPSIADGVSDDNPFIEGRSEALATVPAVSDDRADSAALLLELTLESRRVGTAVGLGRVASGWRGSSPSCKNSLRFVPKASGGGCNCQ